MDRGSTTLSHYHTCPCYLYLNLAYCRNTDSVSMIGRKTATITRHSSSSCQAIITQYLSSRRHFCQLNVARRDWSTVLYGYVVIVSPSSVPQLHKVGLSHRPGEVPFKGGMLSPWLPLSSTLQTYPSSRGRVHCVR
jgi:hypothetical protein